MADRMGDYPQEAPDIQAMLDQGPNGCTRILFELVRNLHRGADFFHCGLRYGAALAGAFSLVDLGA